MKIFDSEVHPWVRVARGWHYLKPGEDRPAPDSLESGKFLWPASQHPDEPPIDEPPDLSGELIEMLDTLGITAALVMPGVHVCRNDMVAEVVARAPDRLKGMARYGNYLPPFVSPTHKQQSLDELEHGLRDLKLCGIGELWLGEWWPKQKEEALADLHDIFSLCKQYNDAPVCIHAGRNCAGDFAGAPGNDSEWDYADPRLLEDFAKMYPSVPIVLFHLGKKDRSLFDLCMEFARNREQVFFNTSFTIPEFVTDAVSQIGADRLAFGTDWYPFAEEDKAEDVHLHKSQIDIIDQAKISDSQKEQIFWKTLDSLVGMPG